MYAPPSNTQTTSNVPKTHPQPLLYVLLSMHLISEPVRLTCLLPLVCPYCANLLTVSVMDNGKNRLECRTCPYELPITDPLYSRRTFPKKERDDIFGGPQAWDNADKTKTQCPAEGCDGAEAAFFQVQIRSADEPMTTFLKVRVSRKQVSRSTFGQD